MEDNAVKDNKLKIKEAYLRMELLPGQLDLVVSSFAKQTKEEMQRHMGAMQSINTSFENRKRNIGVQKDQAYAEADEAKKTIVNQLNELKREMETAEEEYDTKVRFLQDGKKNLEAGIGKGLGQVFHKISQKKANASLGFDNSYNRLMSQENDIYSEKINAADFTYTSQLSTATEEYNSSLRNETQQTERNKIAIFEAAKQMIAAMHPEYLKEQYELLQLSVPSTTNYETAKEIPSALGMGFLHVNLDDWNSEPNLRPVVNLIRENLSFALKSFGRRTELLFPYGRSYSEQRINTLVTFDFSSRSRALEYIRAIEMQMFMSIPCGKLRVTMLDPNDSGSNFSMFSSLGDDDERIISTRIWYDPKRIKERLNILIAQIAHVNQDCLRNEYEDIVAYNEHVGKNAEPLQALFIADFPKHFDNESCEMLEKIVSSGPKCGIYTFIAASVQEIDSRNFNLDNIRQAMNVMHYAGENLTYTYGELEHQVYPLELPSKEEQAAILNTIKNGIKTSDRIIIYFDEISNELTKHREKWFKFDDTNGIDVPIGLEGAARTVQIHLGGELITQHHALISGTIGAGKSTLLHTIIMSILMRYSPEDAQIYLLDFKRGVEFKIYAESNLPNFRVISLDTEPEFGLAVLTYLEQVQAERAQEFHDKNCDNIERYNEIAGSDLEDEIYKIPRIILIIDEFHEMFADKDSEIAKECERLLEQIIRQGRALGIHVILASQTLPDNLSRIYGQIMNRVALQSTAASAQYILDPDNEYVNKLIDVDPGKGVFNDGGGNRDSNHEFRVAYFTEDEQRNLLRQIKDQQNICEQEGMFSEMEVVKPRLLLSSIQDDNDNPLNRFVNTGDIPEKLDFGCPLYLGEEISMINEFSIHLKARRAQNLLILGSDYKRASLLYGFTAMSILFNAYRLSNGNIPQKPLITFFDFGKTAITRSRLSKNSVDMMNDLSARFPHLIRVFGKESLMDGLELLNTEYEQSQTELGNHYVIFAGLNRARRLLDSDSAYAMPPKKMFENLVKNGPEKGFNYIIWANEPSSFCSFYGDLLQEFDYRLVYDLKEEEYEQVIKSASMNTNVGNNVISYNPDEDNKKVRVYSQPLNEWFRIFMDRIEGISAQENWVSGEFEDEF